MALNTSDRSIGSSSTKPPVASSGNASHTAGGRKPIRKVGAQPTRLESLDDANDPLGPLGAPEPPASNAPSLAEQAPTPPKKEVTTKRPQSSQAQAEFGDTDSTNLSIRSRGPPPVQTQPPNVPRQFQPSVSIEQAAKPSFQITVGDPHKVGDLTSSHIVYQVRTRVRPRSTS